MNCLRAHQRHPFLHISETIPIPSSSPIHFLPLFHDPRIPNFKSGTVFYPAFSSSSPHSLSKLEFKLNRVSKLRYSTRANEETKEEGASSSVELEDLGPNSAVYQKTLRLVECAMLAAVSGLVYVLSNSLGIENYFGCFFSLPIVVSSMRWGVAGGRKTVVATAVLLLVLAGPLKSLTYVLTHGLVGFTMGSLWKLGANWSLSIFLCAIVRSLGAMGYVFTSSFLIRENILALITINIHASVTYVFTACGINIIPSMDVIYAIFGILLFLNSGFFVFLLHLLYSVFLARIGMRTTLRLPRWWEKAI